IDLLHLQIVQYYLAFSLRTSLPPSFRCCFIFSPITWANKGGTALPTCLYCCVFVPINSKQSGKDCNLAFSLTVGTRFHLSWNCFLCPVSIVFDVFCVL